MLTQSHVDPGGDGMSLEGTTAEPDGLRLESIPLAGISEGIRIYLSGRSNSASFKTLQTTIDGHLNSGHTKLLLDCERLEFLNSTAMGYLINMADRIEKEHGAVGFIRVPQKVRTVFTLLGLQNFFPIFETEREAFAHFSKSAGARAPAPPPAPSAPAAPPPPASPVPSPSRDPDPVGKPAGLPISHPRWTVLLQTVAERVGPGVLRELCERQKTSPEGEPLLVIRRILRSLKSPDELFGLLDDPTLVGLCTLYQVQSDGGRKERIGGLISFVQRSSTGFMSGILSAARVIPRLEPGTLPVDLTKANLLLTLEKTTLPRRLRSEPAAKKIVLERLVKVFGKERVGRKKKDGGSSVHAVEVDLGGEFGIEIRLGRVLLRPTRGSLREVQRLLGQLVANGKRYRPDHVVAVIVGEVTRAQATLLDEVRELVKSLGMELVHLL
jgi:anti-anti-sigma factor